MGLVHTEQSFRNAKANMTSASTAAVDNDTDGNDFTDIETEEEGKEGDAD